MLPSKLSPPTFIYKKYSGHNIGILGMMSDYNSVFWFGNVPLCWGMGGDIKGEFVW